jgi:hypothetical protein
MVISVGFYNNKYEDGWFMSVLSFVKVVCTQDRTICEIYVNQRPDHLFWSYRRGRKNSIFHAKKSNFCATTGNLWLSVRDRHFNKIVSKMKSVPAEQDHLSLR